ncbi:uncharacterized protein LOC127734722 [Mytilus californianus]|uniref:uncharacterized protein LOC127734722 n=1 Tax=Mytilus californianus TaxID=6549 RepID=UPI002248083D|nr:uncharacterized protein LOC127734722 [Mytilus californianus]
MQLLSLFCLFYTLLFIYRVGCFRNSNSSAISKIIYKFNNQTIPENHTLGCTDKETQTLACLNGGVCFVVDANYRKARCACNIEYIGNRCEIKDQNMDLQQFSKEKKGMNGLIPGITALIVIVLIVSLTVIYIRGIERNDSKIPHHGTSENQYKVEV